jgi:hypothetical protein
VWAYLSKAVIEGQDEEKSNDGGVCPGKMERRTSNRMRGAVNYKPARGSGDMTDSSRRVSASGDSAADKNASRGW